MVADQFDVRAAHPIAYPLASCPTCGSDRLEPVVEQLTKAVHFLCRDCDHCWNVALGYVQRIASATCRGCVERRRCERAYAAEYATAVH